MSPHPPSPAAPPAPLADDSVADGAEAPAIPTELAAAESAMETHAPEAEAVALARFYRLRYFGPLVFFLLLARVATTGVWIAFLFPSSMDLTFPEGAVAARAFDVARGRSAYLDWREWPHAFSPYGPLTYYPTGWIAAALKAAPRPKDALAVGRAQSLACIAGLCAALALIAARAGLPRAWTLVAVALYIDWEPPLTFIASYRPDAAANMFSLIAVAVMMGGEPTRRRVLGVFAALSAAMWFKPVAWGVIFAAGWWLVQTHGRRKGSLALAAFGGANLIAAAWLNHAMHGMLFLNMIDSLNNGIEYTNLLSFYTDNLGAPRAIFLVGVGAAFLRLARGGESEPRRRLLWVAVAASWAAATAQNFKSGADVNYYVESYALASVACALTARDWWRGAAPRSAARREWVLCGLVLPMMLYDGYLGLKSIRRDLRGVSLSWQETDMGKAVGKIQGEILMGNPFLANVRPAPPTIMDFVQYRILVDRGKIDMEILLRKIRNQDFDAIIFTNEDFAMNKGSWLPDALIGTVLSHYERAGSGWPGDVAAMRPKSGPGFARTDRAARTAPLDRGALISIF